MRFLLISAVLLATITVNYGAILKPASRTLSNDFNSEMDGSYNFQYEVSDGQTRNEHSEMKDKKELMIKGGYSYMSPEGTFYTVKYISDKHGYRPIIVGRSTLDKNIKKRHSVLDFLR